MSLPPSAVSRSNAALRQSCNDEGLGEGADICLQRKLEALCTCGKAAAWEAALEQHGLQLPSVQEADVIQAAWGAALTFCACRVRLDSVQGSDVMGFLNLISGTCVDLCILHVMVGSTSQARA